MAGVRRPLVVAALGWALAVGAASRPAAQQPEAHAPHRPGVYPASNECMACHNGLVTAAGEDVSIGVAWRASMMANAARDPYWMGSMRREKMDHPEHEAAIEKECTICHRPTGVAAEGVACALCHQIAPDRLGTPESFVGGFVIAPASGDGAPRMFGPYDVKQGRVAVMQSATGAVPTEGAHIRQSELCATCHTLITQAFGANGEVLGSLPEQVPYQEWRHSAFRTERSCQSCHMPQVTSPMRIASVMGEQREALGRHTFLGGNFFMLRMLNRYRDELGVTALPQELEATAHATMQQLQRDTATLAIDEAAIDAGAVRFTVAVRNLTGHKLPTGYPSRRAWLHVTVRDAAGAAVFESGAIQPDGSIAGNDNDADAAAYEPHYDAITGAGQVQIYESVMATPQGTVTTGLLQATQYVKDNRLLPRGFDKATAPPDVAVHGAARGDADFAADGDRVRYAVPVTGTGPFTVEVELLYQPIGFRWATNLAGYDAPEPQRAVRYYREMASGSSAPLARASTRIQQP